MRQVETSVTFTAGAIGGSGTYQYRFYLKASGATTWTQVQAYGIGDTYAWETTDAQPGTYRIMVYVRNAGSTAAYESYRAMNFKVQ